MSLKQNPRRFASLLPLLIVVLYLSLVAPANQVEATSYCPPVDCIELTVWNPQTCQCECPDQACCDFYWPFIPHGCPGPEAEVVKEVGGKSLTTIR